MAQEFKQGDRVKWNTTQGESKGHESGRRIVETLEKNKSDHTNDGVDHMQKPDELGPRSPEVEARNR